MIMRWLFDQVQQVNRCWKVENNNSSLFPLRAKKQKQGLQSLLESTSTAYQGKLTNPNDR